MKKIHLPMLNVPWKLSILLIQGHFKSRYEIFLFTWVIRDGGAGGAGGALALHF